MWVHQTRVRLQELEYNEAAKAFDEVNLAQSKRLIQALRLFSVTKVETPNEQVKAELEKHHEVEWEYDAAFPRILALTESYFSEEVSDHIIDLRVTFESVGNATERLSRLYLSGRGNRELEFEQMLEAIEQGISTIIKKDSAIYSAMIASIRRRQRELVEPFTPAPEVSTRACHGWFKKMRNFIARHHRSGSATTKHEPKA